MSLAAVYRGMTKEFRPLVEEAIRQGFAVTVDGSTHVKVTGADGRACSLPLTGHSRGRALQSARSRLRRIGVRV